jgi:hypothetical protein
MPVAARERLTSTSPASGITERRPAARHSPTGGQPSTAVGRPDVAHLLGQVCGQRNLPPA